VKPPVGVGAFVAKRLADAEALAAALRLFLAN
jgi:hypothetical protein